MLLLGLGVDRGTRCFARRVLQRFAAAPAAGVFGRLCVSIDAASVSPYGQQQYVDVVKDVIQTVDRMPTAASRGHGQHEQADFLWQLQDGFVFIKTLKIVPK